MPVDVRIAKPMIGLTWYLESIVGGGRASSELGQSR
jgi:hypothetical protein